MVIINTLYSYFGKNKPLRHPTQHLIVAVVGFVVTKIIFGLPINPITISLFIIFTFLPDIDGLFSIFLRKNLVREANGIINYLKDFKFKEAATDAAIHHKKFNKLLIHNFFGLLLVLSFYPIAGIGKNYIFLSMVGATLTHFIFDIADDIFQLGHVKNWLWPYFMILKRGV